MTLKKRAGKEVAISLEHKTAAGTKIQKKLPALL